MKRVHNYLIVALGLLQVLFWSGCRSPEPAQPSAPLPPEPAASGEGEFRITGPYDHKNLAVYFLHSATPDNREFITLNEGLKDGAVAVSEKESAEVGELLIENSSDLPLFLQEGDRLRGGKQDRTLLTSLVVPPKSGKMTIPTMCIERDRWSSGPTLALMDVATEAIAPKEVRLAAKVAGSQGQVWQEIVTVGGAAGAYSRIELSTSSLNEILDNPKVKEACQDYLRELQEIAGTQSSAVGVAFALNGRIEEVDLYHGHTLLEKLYPALLESYAFQAATSGDPSCDTPAPPAAEIAKFMKEGKERSRRAQQVDERNELVIQELENQARCITKYQGVTVHQQWLSKEPSHPDSPEGRK
ncbi:MAG: hypothetical protein HY717_22680 [Planctomycetes bacterium]|nr:hypothetical protein [Planctomycetota bacterium]